MFHKIAFIGLILAGVSFPLWGQKITKNLVYASTPETTLQLDLYMPERVTNPYLIIFVHGGAWFGGSKENPPMELVQRGYAMASINYRKTVEAKFPALVHDVKAATRYLRAHAEDYGYRKDKITLWGTSAGGHLAALAGLTNGHTVLEGKVGNDLNISSDIQCVVDFFGPSDLTTIISQSTPHAVTFRGSALTLMFGKPLDESSEELKLASPVYHVDKTDPPLFVCHGDQDIQVPINQSIQLYGKYMEMGLSVQLEYVHGGGHGGKEFNDPALIDKVEQFLKRVLK